MNQSGGTPLCRAISLNYAECVKVLLAHGANPLQECQGFTPLSLAQYRAKIGKDKDILPIVINYMKDHPDQKQQ